MARQDGFSGVTYPSGIVGSFTGVKLAANQQATPRSAFTELITSKRTDAVFLFMAALIAAILGGFHAFEPGHGKTLMAAYLVGSRGTAKHGVLLGSIVTASHTISVYVLGIITLYASQWIVPERLYPWLGTASGLLVALLGFTLFIRRFVAQDLHSPSNLHHDHSHDGDALVHRHTWWGGHVHEDSSTERDHGEHHDHHSCSHRNSDHAHSHHLDDRADSHSHDKAQAAEGITLRNLFLLGITGGIVPCPAALVVLLGALAIHRLAFGLFLIVAFSAGLAVVLVSFGLAMVYARRFMSRLESRGPLTERWLPLASSAAITVIGVTITIQSLVTAGVFRVGA
jgi:ABC-type nickel/cobalt efflux system permease component RcnA